MFVPCRPFQPSLMFASKARTYLREPPFTCSTLGRLLALPTNIILGWNSLSGANTLAYYGLSTDDVRGDASRVVLRLRRHPGVNLIRLLASSLTFRTNRLVCLSLASLFSLVQCLQVRLEVLTSCLSGERWIER